MINEYYGNASTPNDSFLMHYGVKGMKWGVIRKKLSDVKYNARRKHAEAKMKRLERNADLGVQQKRLNRNLKIAGAGLGTSMASLGAHSLQKVLHKKNMDTLGKQQTALFDFTKKLRENATQATNLHKYVNNPAAATKRLYTMQKNGVLKSGLLSSENVGKTAGNNVGLYSRFANQHWPKASSNISNNVKKSKAAIGTSKKVSYGIAGAGLGVAGVAAGRAALAAYRSSKHGHAKAVAKRDAYRKEMNQRYGKRRSRSRS